MKKILAILVAVVGARIAMADVATTLKYDSVPAHVTLTFSGSFRGDFSVSVTGAVAGATLSQYSYGSKGWKIEATADAGYEVPTFWTCPYDNTVGDSLAMAQVHTGSVTRTGYNIHVYDIRVAPKQSRVNFAVAGGTLPAGAASSITVSYDSTYGPLPTPTRKGYTFDGWYTAAEGGTRVTADTKVTITSAQTLYAHWTPITYTVTFSSNGGSGTMPSMTLTYDQGTNLTANAFTRANYTFSKWKSAEDYTYSDGARVINLASTAGAVVALSAQWTANSYTITFDSDGGTTVAPITKKLGETVLAPVNPTRVGYTFLRWSPAVPTTMPPRDQTVTAVWKVNAYTITFDSAEGSAVSPVTQLMGTTVSASDPVREGYTFAGWSPALPATMPATNLAVTARWTINSYTITFDTAGGSSVSPIKQKYDTAVTPPATPTREGYTFVQWSPAVPRTMPASDMTVTAQWKANTSTITFDSAGGSSVDPITQKYGTAVTPPDSPTREGYTFVQWSPAVPATMPAESLTVKAQWAENPYTIVFDANGGSGTMSPMSLTYGRAVSLTANAFTRAHYAFGGWKTEDGRDYSDRATVSNLTATAGATVRFLAQWTVADSFTITFDPDGGTPVASITKKLGESVGTSPVPTRTGYTFVQWSPAVPATMPPTNMTAKAIWRANEYTISFDSDGGSSVSLVRLAYGATVTSPAAPTRQGYSFAGWSPALPAKMPASNLTVTAQWTTNLYTISFDSAGGSEVLSITQEYGTSVTSPADHPTRTGYTFVQWSPAVPATMPASNLTVTAQWTRDTYTLVFDANGGDGGETMTNWTVAVGSAVTLPPNAFTKTGCAFAGWKTNIVGEVFTNCAKAVKFSGKKGDTVTLYAQWEDYWFTFDASNGVDLHGGFVEVPDGSETSSNAAGRETRKVRYTEGRMFGELPVVTNSTPNEYTFVCWRYERNGVWQTVATNTIVPPLAAGATNLVVRWNHSTTLDEALDVTNFVVVASNKTGAAEWQVVSDPLAKGGLSVMYEEDRTRYPLSSTPDSACLTAELTGPGELTFCWRMESAKVASDGAGATDWTATLERLVFYKNETDFVFGYAADSNHWLSVTRENGCDEYDVAVDCSVGENAMLRWETNTVDLTGLGNVTTKIKWEFQYRAKTDSHPPWPAKIWIDNIQWTGTGIVERTVTTYPLTFNANGGEGEMNSLWIDDEDGTNLTANAFTRDGYTFVCWNTQSNGTGLAIADGARLALAANATLYAQWSANAYTITVDTAGGSPVPPITQECDTPVTAPANPTRTGYSFVEWSPAVPTPMPTNDLTVTAQWTNNIYTITFNSAGGTSVPTLTNDFASSVTPPANPTRTGYGFAGWSPALPATMPANDLTVTAQWTNLLCTITFNLAGGSGLGPITQAYSTKVVLPVTAPVREGYVFTGWSPALPETLTNNLTVTALWKAESHSVTFDTAGGSEVAAITQEYDTDVTAADSVRAGYAFAGWSGLPATMPASNLTATAQWTANAYTITFNSVGGSSVAPITQTYGTAVTPPDSPTRTGYTFVQWSPAVPATMPPNNLTVTAQWATNWYAVAFDSAGGTLVATQMVAYLAAVTAPESPTRAGYTFAGWSGLPATMPASNLTATAKWTANTYTIAFDSAGGTPVATQMVAYLAAVTAPANPTRTGYSFAGWSPALPTTMPASNLTETAQWTANRYTIAFELGDGGSGLESITQDYGSAVVLPTTAPVRKGYTFAGWATEVPSTATSNVTLVALWTAELHSIVFDTAGGSEVPAITQAYGTEVTVEDPTRTGYAFAGWSPALPATMPANDLTVTAQWTTNLYTITFNSAGGSSVAPLTLGYGARVTAPANPTRAGYTFVKWSPALPATMPASNLTVTAQWTANAYTITFDSAGGSPVAPITQKYGTAVTAPANPTRAGYTFVQWSPAVPATMPANNLTVTAAWTPVAKPEPVDPDPPDVEPTGWKLFEEVSSDLVKSATTYLGYLYDAQGRVAGIVQVKRGKFNAKKDVATVTATVTLAGKKSLSYTGGKWHSDSDEVVLTSKKDSRVLRVVLGRRGLSGTYGGNCEIDGAVNAFTSKDAKVKADGQAVLNSIKSAGANFTLAAPSNDRWCYLSIQVKSAGKVSVKGALANGTAVNISSQLLVGEELCCIPVVSTKFANPAFVIWMTRKGVPVGVLGLEDAKLSPGKGKLAAGSVFSVDSSALVAALGSSLLTDYLPNGFTVTAVGTKWVVENGAKAGKVAVDKKTGTLKTTSANWAALKLTCKSKTGQISGSFTAYRLVGGKLKSTTVKVAGVLVDGRGYGAATVKKKTAAVTVAPENN